MFRTTALTAAALLAISLQFSMPARAGTDIDISINLGYGGFYGRNITCNQGRSLVEYRFNYVSKVDCKGSTYVYTGKRNKKWFFVHVSAYTGRITNVRRWK